MSFSVGDTIFAANGRPGVVTAKNEATGELKVERQGEAFEKQRHLGYINGLTPENRDEFNSVLLMIRKESDPRKQVSMLMEKINELKTDPRNHTLTKYLEGEMAHTMNSERIKPKEYTVNEDNVRV